MQIKYWLSIVRNEVVRCYKQERPILKSFLYCQLQDHFVCVYKSASGALLPVIIAVASFRGS